MKRIYLFLTIFSFLVFNRIFVFAQFGDNEFKQLTVNIENQLKTLELKKVAILEFSNPRKDLPNVGNYVKDILFNNFSESKYLDVMLSRKVNQLLQEQKMEKDSLLVSDGQLIIDILGVDAIVWGILTDFPDRIKINTRLIGKKGKLVGVYSSEIQKNEKNKPILEKIFEGKVYGTLISEPGKLFFNENFKTFQINAIPKEWGSGLIIAEDGQGNKFITSNLIGERELVKKIDFPENFSFSFDFSTMSKDNKLEGTLIFVDENDAQFFVKFRASGSGDYVLFPSTQKISVYFSLNKMNNFKLEKKRDIYKLFINNEKIVSGIYTNFRYFKKIILRTNFNQGKFTDFQGIDLGR